MNNTLLIGGPGDGRKLNLPRNPVVLHPVDSKAPEGTSSATYHLISPEWLGNYFGRRGVSLYRHESIDDHQALTMLLHRYTAAPDPKKKACPVCEGTGTQDWD
jgi:hypothetical protein